MSACLLLSDEHRSMVLFHLPKGEGGDLAECANCLNWIMENRVSGGRPEISNRILETLSARGPPVLRVREYPEGRRDMFRGRQGNRNTMRRTNWTLLYL